MAENTIDAYSELPAPEILPTVPQLPAPELPPTAPQLPDPDIANIIPDDLQRIIPDLGNLTGANYLTRTATGQIVTPSGQDVVPGMNLPQMALDFEMRMQSVLTPDLMMEIQEVWLGNSAPSEVPNGFSFESLTNAIAFTHNVSDFGETSVITDADQLTSLSKRISDASSGAQQNLFCDADDDDNLIEIRPQDAAQLGGLRAKGGNDKVFGSQLNDIVNGDAGNDQIVGASGHDLLRGGQGNDLIEGGEGDDLLKGDDGDDCLVGGAGNDVLRGGAGRDVLIGKAGDDILIGGGDGDFLKGSEGADQFILRADMFTNRADLADRLLDFNPGQSDKIKIVSFPGMGAISFAPVDVNTDNMMDTAILSSRGVVGVIMSTDPLSVDRASISIVGSQDTTLSLIG
jgi:RTX toxins and related Ca2+-binding proteins